MCRLTLETTAAEPTRPARDAAAAPLTRAEYRRRLAAEAEAARAAQAGDVLDGAEVPRTAVAEEAPGSAPSDGTPAEAPVSGDVPRAEHRFEDIFEAAARLFAATAEAPVAPTIPPQAPASMPSAPASAPHVAAPRTHAMRVVKQVAAGSLSLGAMTVVGLLAFSTMVPSSAVATSASADLAAAAAPAAKQPAQEIQAFVASDVVDDESLDRPEAYGVVSMSEIAAESGVTQFAGTWVNDPAAEVQYPFPVGVPISSGFQTIEYYNEFGSWHNGVDLTPGGGAEIHAVAAGTVRIATESGGTYGVTVLIDHVIDGRTVSTRYGHMRYGSLRVAAGDTVEAGEVIGLVGSTGKSTGEHLHLEVLLDGTTPTDPLPWIREHTS